jgi:hypothetical protein
VISLSHQAPFSLVLVQLGRVFSLPREKVAPPHDPVFLPGDVGLTPDQMLEMRFAQGRDR